MTLQLNITLLDITTTLLRDGWGYGGIRQLARVYAKTRVTGYVREYGGVYERV